MFIDYYAVLGVPPTATADEIKSAYWMRAKKLHPDVNQHCDTTKEMQALNEAYMILRDATNRQMYDQEFHQYHAWTASHTATQKEAEYKYTNEEFAEKAREAARTARAMGNQLFEETKELLVVAGKEAVRGTLIYGLCGIGLFLLALAAAQCSRQSLGSVSHQTRMLPTDSADEAVLCMAESPKKVAEDFVRWKYEQASQQPQSQRMTYVKTLFDIDVIAASIQEEGKRRGLSKLISRQNAYEITCELLTQAVGKSKVNVTNITTNQLPSSVSVVVQFTATSIGGGLDPQLKNVFREYYRQTPNAGAMLAQQYQGAPESAFQSAESLIDYLEMKQTASVPVKHEYEFIFDNNTGRIIDWKVWWADGNPRKSHFLMYVDEIERLR